MPTTGPGLTPRRPGSLPHHSEGVGGVPSHQGARHSPPCRGKAEVWREGRRRAQEGLPGRLWVSLSSAPPSLIRLLFHPGPATKADSKLQCSPLRSRLWPGRDSARHRGRAGLQGLRSPGQGRPPWTPGESQSPVTGRLRKGPVTSGGPSTRRGEQGRALRGSSHTAHAGTMAVWTGPTEVPGREEAARHMRTALAVTPHRAAQPGGQSRARGRCCLYLRNPDNPVPSPQRSRERCESVLGPWVAPM